MLSIGKKLRRITMNKWIIIDRIVDKRLVKINEVNDLLYYKDMHMFYSY